MGEEDSRASNVRNLQRDLEAQPQTTALESQPTVPQEPFRRRPRWHPTGTQVQNGTAAPTLSFYKTFFDDAAQDNGPDRCLFLCWGPPGNQPAINIPVSDPDVETKIFSDVRKRWFEHRGRWRRLLPFYGVVAMKEIKVNIFNTT